MSSDTSPRKPCMEVVTNCFDSCGNPYIEFSTIEAFIDANRSRLKNALLVVHYADVYTEDDIPKLEAAKVWNPRGLIGTEKAEHIHLALEFKNAVYYSSVAKQLGLSVGCIQKPRAKKYQFDAMATYLTHKSPVEQAKGKHRYPDSEVMVLVGDFDYTEVTDNYMKWADEQAKKAEKAAHRKRKMPFINPVVDGNRVVIGDKVFEPTNPDDTHFVDMVRKPLGEDAVRAIVNLIEAGDMTIKDVISEYRYAAYLEHKRDFDAARIRYIKAHHAMASRYNFYIGPSFDVKDGGGIGKTAMSRMLAQALFPDLEDFEAYHEVCDLKVPFEGYDWQPCIIWNEARACGLTRILGREKVFDILEPHPGKNQINVKYGSTILTNSVNIINGIAPYKEFMLGLAEAYKDVFGSDNDDEPTNQVFRRFPFILELTPDSFDFYVNQGFFNELYGYRDYVRAVHYGVSIRDFMNKYSDGARLELGTRLLGPVTDKYKELKSKLEVVKRDVADLDDTDYQFDIQVFEPGDDGAITPSCEPKPVLPSPTPAEPEPAPVEVTLYTSVREFPDYEELVGSARDELRAAADRDWHPVRYYGTPEYERRKGLLDEAKRLDADAEKYRGRADSIHWMWDEFEKRALQYFATLSPSAVKNVCAVTERNASHPKLLAMSCREFLGVDKAKWWVNNGGESFRPTDFEVLRVFASAYKEAFDMAPYDLDSLGVVDTRVQPSEWLSKTSEALSEAVRLRDEAEAMLEADKAKGDAPEPSIDEIDALLAQKYADRLVQVEPIEEAEFVGVTSSADDDFDPRDLYE